jgi:hypothetical protein
MHKYELGDLALMFGGVIAGLRDLKLADQLSILPTRPDFFFVLASNLDGLSIMCRSFDADPALIFNSRAFETLSRTGKSVVRQYCRRS